MKPIEFVIASDELHFSNPIMPQRSTFLQQPAVAVASNLKNRRPNPWKKATDKKI